ncbi:MAG: 3-methyl-2-oxobutanoate hydroxymethyltransferase [Anaerolineae bacterium]|nr:3-methyl-2-oxobutanoate hydroxymethyltransferase [Anaerolineae bacterium]
MRTTVSFFQKQKDNQIPITMVTAYDATLGRLAEQAGVQTLLVGDSLGMVVQGHENTIPVTLDAMIYHTQMVVRGTRKAFVIADMPFMTYNISSDQALANAGRLIQETGCQAVKLEGGERIAATLERLVENGIPVLAHIGLTPQSVHRYGGWRVQGKTPAEVQQLLADALAVQAAGAFAVVLELIPAELAAYLTQQLTIPSIGIGAGAGCSGQVQVMHDILGLLEDFTPRHARRYASLAQQAVSAISTYRHEVETGVFPAEQHSTPASEDLAQYLYGQQAKP